LLNYSCSFSWQLKSTLYSDFLLQFLTASRVARNATPGEEQALAESVKRGGACLCVGDRFAVAKTRVIPPFNFASRATHRGIG